MPAFEVTSALRGAIGEALLGGHKGAIEGFFLDWCVDDLARHDPEWLPPGAFSTGLEIARPPVSYDVYVDGDYASWRPDLLYEVAFRPDRRDASWDPYAVEYPLEVKTGGAAALAENQRAAMRVVDGHDTPVFPVLARVSLSGLPASFEVSVRRVRADRDDPIPDYTAPERVRVEPPGSDAQTTLDDLDPDPVDPDAPPDDPDPPPRDPDSGE